MVEAQKGLRPEPAYGYMPQGSEEGRKAVQRLRVDANRRRRRRKVIGRLVVVIVVAGIGVGAYFGYEAFQEFQVDAGPELRIEPGSGLTPLAIVDDQLRAQGTVVAGSRTGGYLDSSDEARDVVAVRGSGASDIADLSEAPTTIADVPERLDVVVTRFDLSTDTTTVAQRFAIDVAGDTYVSTTVAGDRVLAVTGTSDETYYQYDERAGVLGSAARGELSRRPGPDALFVAPITEAAIFPPNVAIHAESIVLDLVDSDGAVLLAAGYTIDVEGFRFAQPGAARDWLAILTSADPAHRPSIEPGTVSETDATPEDLSDVTAAVAALPLRDDVDLSLAPRPQRGEAIVAWRVGSDGFLSDLYVDLADGGAHWFYRVADGDSAPIKAAFDAS